MFSVFHSTSRTPELYEGREAGGVWGEDGRKTYVENHDSCGFSYCHSWGSHNDVRKRPRTNRKRKKEDEGAITRFMLLPHGATAGWRRGRGKSCSSCFCMILLRLVVYFYIMRRKSNHHRIPRWIPPPNCHTLNVSAAGASVGLPRVRQVWRTDGIFSARDDGRHGPHEPGPYGQALNVKEPDPPRARLLCRCCILRLSLSPREHVPDLGLTRRRRARLCLARLPALVSSWARV